MVLESVIGGSTVHLSITGTLLAADASRLRATPGISF
jgi:hypothetical protein